MNSLFKLNKKIVASLLTVAISTALFAQGPNRTFGKFRKLNEKNKTEYICAENCATIILIYEKGTYINSVKAAIAIDDRYSIASEKGYYIEYKIPTGIHKISLPQGVNQGKTIHKMQECDSPSSSFIRLSSMFSNKENYIIQLGADITDLKYNRTNVPYTNKIFAPQINYLTYGRNFETGKTYYYKSLKLPKKIGSLSCGPIITETTQEDFEAIIKSKNIKGKGELFIHKNTNFQPQ